VLFPGAGLLVLSAWCLGVLNSHRRFLLSYAAPVAWNLAIIVTVVAGGSHADEAGTALLAAVGSVIGSGLQVGIQVPAVRRLLRQWRPALSTASPDVRQVIGNFVPVFMGRGVVQLSAFVDTMLGSLLGTGAVAGLNAAQMLYTLPVSLFGMSVSAAELPAMSSATGTDAEIAQALRRRLEPGLRRIAFFVVPSAVAFLVFGRELSAALFQTGRFSAEDSLYVWGILAGSAIGLLAATLGRLYSSALYALRDTRAPLRFAIIRVTVGVLLGTVAALWLPGWVGLDARWGAAGLTVASALAAMLEYSLLRRAIRSRIGAVDISLGLLAGLWLAATLGAALGVGCGFLLPAMHPALRAALVLTPFGTCYLVLTDRFGVPESRDLFRRIVRR
jgi:putative peptidoglycan lipid II flippase